MQSIERLGDLGFISRKPHSNAGFMLRYTIAYHLVLWGLLWPSNHQSFVPYKWITLVPKNSLFFCNCHQPSKPSYMLEPKQKSFFFSRLSMLSNGEMSSLCCCCCFHYIFFFHAWIPSFTKNCHLVIYHLSKKMVALNSLIP